MRIIQEANKKLTMNKNIKQLRSKKKSEEKWEGKKKPVVIDKINERKKRKEFKDICKTWKKN